MSEMIWQRVDLLITQSMCDNRSLTELLPIYGTPLGVGKEDTQEAGGASSRMRNSNVIDSWRWGWGK